MGFFKRRKKRRQEEERLRQEELYRRIEEEPEDLRDNAKIQEYIVRRCEQMAQAGKELNEEKAEYRIVTDYLKDIQLL